MCGKRIEENLKVFSKTKTKKWVGISQNPWKIHHN